MSQRKGKGTRPRDPSAPTPASSATTSNATSATTSASSATPTTGASSATPTTGASSATPATSSAASDPREASGVTDPWTGYWLAPVAAVRPWLLTKLTLILFAFDVLHTHLGPAWRYGAADFNVPHFPLLGALPIPTTAAYVGMLFFVSTSALVCALVPRPPRPLLLAIAALYTWGWSCSMHDSYQHHYLLSFVLVAIALLPTLDAHQMFGAATTPSAAPHGVVPRVHALGMWLLTSACAVVYSFTAVSKTEPDWLSGDAMRSITHGGESVQGAIDLAADLGIDEDQFWWLLGHGVVPAQIVIALAYLLAPLADGPSTSAERARFSELVGDLFAPGGRGPAIVGGSLVGAALGLVVGFALGLGAVGTSATTVLVALTGTVLFFDASTWRFVLQPFDPASVPASARVRGVIAAIGLVTALSFHVGAEHLSLAIGWFSAYMIVIALVTFLPARWLSLAVFAFSAPLRARATDWDSPLVVPRLVLAGLAGGGALVVMGQLADLPGAMNAALVLVLVLALFVGGAIGGRVPRREAMPFALACALAGTLLSAWVHVSPARFDYYRFAGGDFRRRLQYDEALHAYERSNRYAPPGESRDDRIEEMRAMIRERRGLPTADEE
jgi:hypothetical protein